MSEGSWESVGRHSKEFFLRAAVSFSLVTISVILAISSIHLIWRWIVECICSNSTTLSGVRSSHLMVLNEHQTYVMCHQLFEEVVWISCNCTLQGAAAGDGACQKKKRKLVSPLPVAISTLAPVALCTGDDVCNTCDARAELVQACLLALPAPLQALRRSVLARKAAAGIKLKLCRLSNTTFAL